MAKQTLLQLTQDILSSLDSDQVNSISDTVESLQVANLVKNKYYDIISRGNLPAQKVLLQLTASTDPDRPTLMYVPAGVTDIEWIKYFDSNPDDSQEQSQFGAYSHGVNEDLVSSTDPSGITLPGYKYVTILGIDQFLDMINRFNNTDSNVVSYSFQEGGVNFTLYFKDDIQPKYCTVIENTYILFDSYDSGFDTTLQESKTMVYGTKVTPFVMEDSFIPDIDDEQFSLLLNEVKSLAFYELKQMPHPKADQEIRRQWSSVQKGKAVSNKPTAFEQLSNFGRVPRTGGFSGGGYGAYKWMRQSGP